MRAAAVTIVGQSPNPSSVRHAVSFTFTVAATAPGSGTPTGTVTVSDGTQTCSASVTAGSCSITFSSAGGRTVTAGYAGDGNFAVSTSAGVTQTVNAAGTTTTITGHAPDPSVVGQGIAITFTVTSAGGTPTGNVTVSDGTVTCSATVAQAGCTLTPLTPGTKTLIATYAGDGNFATSTSDGVTHPVNLTGTPSASRSSVSASPSQITASNGTSVSTTTGTVRDAFDNLLSGATVTLPATGVGNSLTASGITDATGQMTGTLSSTAAETKTITATVGSVILADKPSVIVDPAAASGLVFTVEPSNVVLGSRLAPVVVTARDAFGNVATGFTGLVGVAIGTDGSLLKNAVLGGSTSVAAASGRAPLAGMAARDLGIRGIRAASAAAASTRAASTPFNVPARL